MYTVKRLCGKDEKHVFEETEYGHENRDMAIAQAANLASQLAKETRGRIRATCAYVGYITFVVESNTERFGGFAIYFQEDNY